MLMSSSTGRWRLPPQNLFRRNGGEVAAAKAGETSPDEGIKTTPHFAEDYPKQFKQLAAPGSGATARYKTRTGGGHGV
jgi:hypothetical protein